MQDVLLRTCGSSSAAARKAKATGLSENDVGLLAARFDTGGFVHYPDFLAYFRAESLRRDTDGASISPFLLSSEWDRLKSCASDVFCNHLHDSLCSQLGHSRRHLLPRPPQMLCPQQARPIRTLRAPYRGQNKKRSIRLSLRAAKKPSSQLRRRLMRARTGSRRRGPRTRRRSPSQRFRFLSRGQRR